MKKIYALGETVYDIIFKDNQPVAAKAGGSMLNTCVSLGRTKQNVHFISELANDKVGTIIDNFLQQNGINTDYVYRYDEGKSALALAFLDEKNNADYSFFKHYPENRLAIKVADFRENDIFLFGSFYSITEAITPHLQKFIDKARKQKTIIIYDPNFRQSHLQDLEKLRKNIEGNMQNAHIVRGSDEDFRNIFNAETSVQAYEAVSKFCQILFYTDSEKGVFVHTPKHNLRFDVLKIKPVSTIGAGDNFNAGMIYALSKNKIKFDDLEMLNEKCLEKIIQTAIGFATEVCLSYDNYISEKYAQKICNE